MARMRRGSAAVLLRVCIGHIREELQKEQELPYQINQVSHRVQQQQHFLHRYRFRKMSRSV